MSERQAARERLRGIRAGPFQVYPSVTPTLAYDTNVYAAPSGEGDAILTLSGAVVAEMATGRSTLRVKANASRSVYQRFSSENATQWGVGLDGGWALPADFRLTTAISYDRRVEPRTSSGAPITTGSPARYGAVSASSDLSWQGARLSATIGGSFDKYDYRNLDVGGVSLDQQFRNYRSAEVRARVGYNFDGQRELFVQVDRHWSTYQLPDPATNTDRDSRGWQARIGLSSAITPLIRGTISIGYLREAFDLVSAKPVAAMAFNASLDWLVTPITTVHLDASRQLENGASNDFSGYLASHLAVSIDHELTRDCLINLGVSYDGASFRSIDRNDTLLGAQIGVRQQLTSNLFARFDVKHQQRESSGAAQGFDFSQQVVSASVTYQF